METAPSSTVHSTHQISVHPSKVKDAAEFWDDHSLTSMVDVRYWLGVRAIREAVNRQLTGRPDFLFIESFARSFEDTWPLKRALSVGCGTGELERGIVDLGVVQHCDGIDVSKASLAAARNAAEQIGLGDRISYFESGASSWLGATRSMARYDLIFFHGSLHHIEDLEETLDGALSALRPGSGIVYVDEYVGPSRDEWDEEDLGFAAGLFSNVAAAHRRTERVWPPIAIEDPTEMIRSSEIPAMLRARFELAQYRPYYGNVLMPLVNAIKGGSLDRPEIVEILEHGIALEALLARRQIVDPLYAIFVCRAR